MLIGEVMPGVQSAAFTLLIPAGAAYEVAEGQGGRGRGHDGRRVDHAGGRAARQPRVAHGARQPGRQPRRECPDPAHQPLGRDAGPQPGPALEIFADIVLRPHFDEEEIEPIRASACRTSGAWRTTPAPR